jgi:hypothetical protein
MKQRSTELLITFGIVAKVQFCTLLSERENDNNLEMRLWFFDIPYTERRINKILMGRWFWIMSLFDRLGLA